MKEMNGAVAAEIATNENENANVAGANTDAEVVDTINAGLDYTKTCKITSRVSKVRPIFDGDDRSTLAYIVLQLTDEITNMSDGEVVQTHDVLFHPYYLTNDLCDASDIFAMLASSGDALTAKDFACLASSTVTLVRTFHHAGDEYVKYDGSVENYEEDGFMFGLQRVKLSALGEKLLMNKLM